MFVKVYLQQLYQCFAKNKRSFMFNYMSCMHHDGANVTLYLNARLDLFTTFFDSFS